MIGSHTGDPETPHGSLPHSPDDLLGQDISYPIDTKNLGIHGRLGLKAVDHDDCSQSLGWFNPPRAG